MWTCLELNQFVTEKCDVEVSHDIKVVIIHIVIVVAFVAIIGEGALACASKV